MPGEHVIDARRFADALLEQREMGLKGGIYHLTQIQLAYHSNRIEGGRLTEEQTRYIYEASLRGLPRDVHHAPCAHPILQRLVGEVRQQRIDGRTADLSPSGFG
ncbi:hypothetical protein [Microbacterium profundi]|uniref:hypothetical protein n=1 Tax=Microbacterium profundi TaxID=450380 RepID=UPI00051A52FE|nr:hypothetical protein [Microbacterium profundi]